MSKKGWWLLGFLSVLVIIAVIATEISPDLAPRTGRTLSCTDSDGGQNVDILGEVCVSGSSSRSIGASSCVSDSCTSDGKVIERYCAANGGQSVVVECGPGLTCVEGVCDVEVGPEDVQEIARVFVTSQTYDGNLGGLTGADAICQSLGAEIPAGEGGGTWKAWISDDSESPSTRFSQFQSLYVLLNGEVVATNWDQLTDSILENPINIDENGNLVEPGSVWTSTDTSGNPLQPNCLSWSSESDLEFARTGNSDSSNFLWTSEIASSTCDSMNRIYCFEQLSNDLITEYENFEEVTKLTYGESTAHDKFGSFTDVSNDVAIIGTLIADSLDINSGAAYIYRYNGNDWALEQELLPTGNSPEGDSFGTSVSVHGNVAAVGASTDDSHEGGHLGAVYIYRYDGNSWVQEQKIYPSTSGNGFFGTDIVLSNNLLFIGEPFDDDFFNEAGAVHVYRYNGNDWALEQKLIDPNQAAFRRFGKHLDSDGEKLAVGTPLDSEFGTNSGVVYIFEKQGNSWVNTHEIHSPNPSAGNNFGFGVEIDGEWLAASSLEGGNTPSKVFMFKFDQLNGWEFKQKVGPNDANTLGEDYFGTGPSDSTNIDSIDMDDGLMVVGSEQDSPLSSQTGSAFIFENIGDYWIEKQMLFPIVASETFAGKFGKSVSINRNNIVVGAFRDSTVATQAGATYIYSTCVGPGCENEIYCGDGIVNGAETCDGYEICTLPSGYPGLQICSQDCTTLGSCIDSGASCGDGFVSGPEECDGENLAGISNLCSDFDQKYLSGFISCDGLCNYDLTECSSIPVSRVFVSSSSYTGTEVSSLVNADNECQQLASSAGFGGNWKAWISDSSTSASERLVQSSGPYVRAIQPTTVIADNWDDLTDGSIDTSILFSESGSALSNKDVWTGTNSDGTSNNNNCGDWNFEGLSGRVGRSSSTTLWTSFVSRSCDSIGHLYCVEQI